MSGLFTRLAQQHINQNKSIITPAQSLVFPADTGVSHTREGDSEHEKVQESHQQEPDTKNNSADNFRNDYSNKPESKTSATYELDALKQTTNTHADSVIAPALTPVINSNITGTSSGEEGISLSNASLDELDNVSSKHPQLAGNINSTLKPLISPKDSAKDKETVGSKLDSSHLSHDNDSVSVSESIITRQQVTPSSLKNRNSPARQKSTSLIQDENQTIINVSIGQIDIKATPADDAEQKSPKRSQRSDTSALEAYHQKRKQGQK